jgi:hypothetical protein
MEMRRAINLLRLRRYEKPWKMGGLRIGRRLAMNTDPESKENESSTWMSRMDRYGWDIVKCIAYHGEW